MRRRAFNRARWRRARRLRFAHARAVEDLLLWRDPKKSGVVFAGISLLYILLEWTGLSLLTIIANSLLVLVSLSFLWNNIASFAGRYGTWQGQHCSIGTKCRFHLLNAPRRSRPGVPVPETFRSGVSERQVKSYAEFATIYLNKALGMLQRRASQCPAVRLPGS